MKHIIKFLYVIILVISFSSCENEIIKFDSSKTFVGFDVKTINAPENVASTAVPVMIAGIENGNSVTVNFEISTEGIAKPAVEGVDFTIGTSGSVTFPNGAGYSNISVIPVDNDYFTGDKSFYITVTTNSANYPNGRENTVLVVLKDNEHPLAKWIGDYVVTAASYGDPGNWDETWTVTTAPDPDDPDNLLISGVATAGSGPIKATLNVADMTITLSPGQSLGTVYGGYVIGVYKGTEDLNYSEDEPLTGTIGDDGTISIDLWGNIITEGTYAGSAWDVFNTTWNKQ